MTEELFEQLGSADDRPLAPAWGHRGLRTGRGPRLPGLVGGTFRVANAAQPSDTRSWAIVMPCRVSARSTGS